MRVGETSRTAETIALYRMLDGILNEEPILGDPYAAHMIRRGYRIPAQSRILRSLYTRFVTDLRPLMITFAARSRITEDVLAEKARQGPVQWVLLGAGLDTFAWRHPEHADVPQFEVDHPATQAHKRRLISRLGLAPPRNHHFVEIDFEKTRISDALKAAGFDPATPTVFAWLGVTYYLTRAAIETTLADAASIAAPGCTLVCDYRLPDRCVDPRDLDLQRTGDRFNEKAGEPHLTKFQPDEWQPLAKQAGWTIVSDIGDTELAQRFAQQCQNGVLPASYYRILTLGR